MPLYHLYVSYHIYHDTPTSEIYTLSLHDALPIFAQEVRYQLDARPGEVLYWVTDMGWIMGPLEMVGGHANGAAVLMYEGAPNYPEADRLWEMCERHGVTILGISPTLIRALMPAGEEMVTKHDLSKLRILGSTGEPWNPEPYKWF